MWIAKVEFLGIPWVWDHKFRTADLTGFCRCLCCPGSVMFYFDAFVKAPFYRLNQPLIVWMPSTEEESNTTIAILFVSDFSALGSTVEEALLEAVCHIPWDLHTVGEIIYVPSVYFLLPWLQPWRRKGDSSWVVLFSLVLLHFTCWLMARSHWISWILKSILPTTLSVLVISTGPWCKGFCSWNLAIVNMTSPCHPVIRAVTSYFLAVGSILLWLLTCSNWLGKSYWPHYFVNEWGDEL